MSISSTPVREQTPSRSLAAFSSPSMSTVKADLDAARESYFAAVVGRSPMPPRQSYIPMTPRRGIVNRQITTGDFVVDTNATNDQHKSRLTDSTGLVLSTASGLVHSFTSISERLMQHLEKSHQNALTFKNEYKFVTPQGTALADVATEGGLRLPVEVIADRWLKRPRHAPQSILLPLLDRITGGNAVAHRNDSRATAAGAVQTNDELGPIADGHGNVSNVTTENVNQVIPARVPRVALLDTTELFRGVDPHVDTSIPLKVSTYAKLPKPTLSEVIVAQHDFLHVDIRGQAREELDRSEPEVQRLRKEIIMLQGEIDTLLSLQQYGEVEIVTRKLLNFEAQLMELLITRMAFLDHNTEANEFLKDRDQLLKDAQRILGIYRSDKDKAVADVAFDFRRCADLRQKADGRIAEADQKFEKNESDYEARLKLNEKHHLEILNEITERVRILEKLSEDRQEMTEVHIKAREIHDRDVFAANELKDRVSDYEALLNQVKAYLGDELSLVDALDAHNNSMNRLLNGIDVEGPLRAMRFAELSALKKVYGDFVSTSGSLVTKKQHRFDALERQTRLSQLQKDTAKESLDPDVHRHDSEMETLAALLHDTETAIAALEAQQDAVEILVAKPLAEYEEECQNRAIPFEHPSLSTTEHVVGQRRAFVDRTQQYVDEETDVVTRKKEALFKLRNQAAKDQAAHTARAANASPTPARSLAGGAAAAAGRYGFNNSTYTGSGSNAAGSPIAADASVAMTSTRSVGGYVSSHGASGGGAGFGGYGAAGHVAVTGSSYSASVAESSPNRETSSSD